MSPPTTTIDTPADLYEFIVNSDLLSEPSGELCGRVRITPEGKNYYEDQHRSELYRFAYRQALELRRKNPALSEVPKFDNGKHGIFTLVQWCQNNASTPMNALPHQEIVTEIARNINVLTPKWDTFCQWMEESGELLHRYQTEPFPERDALVKRVEDTEKAFADARKTSDRPPSEEQVRAIRELADAHDDALKALRDAGWSPWSECGASLPGECHTDMLRLRPWGLFFARDVLNPVNWLLNKPNPREATDDQRLLRAFALLSVLHDVYAKSGDRRICHADARHPSYSPYEGTWFTRDTFYTVLERRIREGDMDVEIEEAWDRVQSHLLKQAAPAVGDETPPDANDSPWPVLTDWQQTMFDEIAACPTTLSEYTLQQRLPATRNDAERPARKTIRSGLKVLGEHGLTEYPNGPRGGVTLSPKGRQMAEWIAQNG